MHSAGKRSYRPSKIDCFHTFTAPQTPTVQRIAVKDTSFTLLSHIRMLRMYWDIGGMLQQSQDADGWGKKTLQRLAEDLKNDYSEIKGFTVRNMQYMVQFFNEYNQELTMIKRTASSIAKSVISQLDEYNFTLPIKHLDWTHNLVLIKQRAENFTSLLTIYYLHRRKRVKSVFL